MYKNFFKKYFFLSFFILNLNFLYTENLIKIGIVPPYIRNENTETLFYHKNFTFEILFNFDNTKTLEFEILNILFTNNEFSYIKECEDEAIKVDVDYLLYSTIQSNNDVLNFKVQIINPYNKNVIFSKIYKKAKDLFINESLSDCVIDIIKIIKNKELDKPINKNKYAKKNTLKENNEEDKEFNEYREKYTHEIFFLNGLFKNHPGIVSFLELYTGYNFSPLKYFSLESGVFIGTGYLDKSINLSNFSIKNAFFGGYTGFSFFISGIVEPSIGLRLELLYITSNTGYLSIPIDFGLKIYINSKNIIRINASFQFTSFNFNELMWENNYIIGLLIGYAKKI